MSLPSAVIDAMLASGCTADQLAAAMKAANAQAEQKAAERRAKDAERKRRSRGVTHCHADTAGHDGTEEAPSPFPDKETSPTPPKEINPNPLTPKPTARGVRIPADFEPDTGWAVSQGLSISQAQTEVAKFRDYWAAKTGQGATKLDWPATWRLWVRNVRPNARGSPAPNGRPVKGTDAFFVQADELDERSREVRSKPGDWDDAGRVPILTIEHRRQ